METTPPGAHRATAVEEATLRSVLGHFATGVCVVTGVAGGVPAGLSLQSFFSVSLDPPLIAISPSRSSGSWPMIERSGAFCVNVLAGDQEALCRTFARSGVDKFDGVGWDPAPTGSPRLHDVLAWVDCRVEAVHAAGDHWLVLGAVVDLGSRTGEPLLFYRGGFGAFRP
jgi:3-hydroxy-9,10-secoandrosta-1,3,5(10)-triene-9,17-dione monooxygenase reductase component